jgi:hypothetical protein
MELSWSVRCGLAPTPSPTRRRVQWMLNKERGPLHGHQRGHPPGHPRGLLHGHGQSAVALITSRSSSRNNWVRSSRLATPAHAASTIQAAARSFQDSRRAAISAALRSNPRFWRKCRMFHTERQRSVDGRRGTAIRPRNWLEPVLSDVCSPDDGFPRCSGRSIWERVSACLDSRRVLDRSAPLSLRGCFQDPAGPSIVAS